MFAALFLKNGIIGNLPGLALRTKAIYRKADFQGTCRVAAKRSTQRNWSAVSGTCKPRATVSRLKASSGANPSAVSNAAKSKEERPIEALQWTATLRPAWASALKSSTNRENDAVDGGVSRSGIGKDRKTIPLASQSSPLLMKDLAQQLRRPEAWKPTHPPPLVSFDPVRPPASRPREGAERWRGEADCQFQPSRVSSCDITVLITGGCSNGFWYFYGQAVAALNR